ncbi:hypothetical protein V6N13_081166 [Hibiscus sabdariffa]
MVPGSLNLPIETVGDGEALSTVEAEGNEAVAQTSFNATTPSELPVENDIVGTVSCPYDADVSLSDTNVLGTTDSFGGCSSRSLHADGVVLPTDEFVTAQATNTHLMMTRSKRGIFKPKLYSATVNNDEAPATIEQAL